MMKIDLKKGNKVDKLIMFWEVLPKFKSTDGCNKQYNNGNSVAIATLVAITTSIGNVNIISGKVKNSLILTLDEKLKKAAVVSTNIVEDKKKNLLKEANMIGNAEM